jgi:hypothetical protein
MVYYLGEGRREWVRVANYFIRYINTGADSVTVPHGDVFTITKPTADRTLILSTLQPFSFASLLMRRRNRAA